MSTQEYYVINRKGEKEPIRIAKVQKRIEELCLMDPALEVDSGHIAIETMKQFPSHPISTTKIDKITASVCEGLFISSGMRTEFDKLASRLLVSSHHKNTSSSFVDKVNLLNTQYRRVHAAEGELAEQIKLMSATFVEFANRHRAAIEAKIDYSRDFLLNAAGFKTLLRSYLLKDINETVVERWQDAIMRVAIGVHLRDAENSMDQIFQLYDAISQQLCTHATPTIFNAGIINGQLSSCFLMGSDDSLHGIMKAATDAATISKYAGGIGLHNKWRAAGSYIKSTNGRTNGKIPFYDIMSSVSRAVDQGGSKRKGSFAIYEPLHDAEIFNFLSLRSITGENKNRVLFLAVWVPDLFMERVKSGELWSMFSSDECPSLYDTWGDEYRSAYLACESNPNLIRKQVPARDLFKMICNIQNESGMPYIVYGDSANRYSNQQNLGTIRSSNLCSEIIMYSDSSEYGVCNLASICLGRFVEDGDLGYREFPAQPRFNYTKLIDTVKLLVNTLNAVIDNNFYPVPEAARSNLLHRPIGLGVQGLANVFAMMQITFESPEARTINRKIFETIYYAAVSESCAIAQREERCIKAALKRDGVVHIGDVEFKDSADLPPYMGAYSSFQGSPLHQGKFRWELSGLKPEDLLLKYDWDSLRAKIQRYGVKNSLLVALMPTASTSLIMDQIEAFEPFKTNLHLRNVNAGSMFTYNKYMIHDFHKLGILNTALTQHILSNNGSVQKIDNLPEFIKQKYKTAYEIDNEALLQLAIDRQHFVDQSQSMNWYMEKGVNYNEFKKLQFMAWRSGIVTGAYYTHQLPVSEALKITVDPTFLGSFKVDINDDFDGDMCLACGS